MSEYIGRPVIRVELCVRLCCDGPYPGDGYGGGEPPQVQVSVDVTAERARLREAAAQLTDADLGLVAEA